MFTHSLVNADNPLTQFASLIHTFHTAIITKKLETNFCPGELYSSNDEVITSDKEIQVYQVLQTVIVLSGHSSDTYHKSIEGGQQ